MNLKNENRWFFFIYSTAYICHWSRKFGLTIFTVGLKKELKLFKQVSNLKYNDMYQENKI